MMTSGEHGVLVVGAGPSGLAAALGLAHAGVAVRVVDRSARGADTSRAAVVHPATLEALDEVGAGVALLERALRVPRFEVRDGARRLAVIDYTDLQTRHPFMAMVPQATTEAVLQERLADLGVQVERDAELVSLAQDVDGVIASVVGPGAEEEVRASWVVGADGMHSRTRELVGIDFPGAAYAQSFVLADAEMEWPVPRDAVSLTFAAAGLLVVAPLPGGRFRLVATADDPPERPGQDRLQALVRERAGAGVIGDIGWSGRFRVNHRLASSYRAGRVLLVGDAAHVHSPAGGQGMNLGIRDGLALAALVAHGGDLDAYEARRRPVARRVIALTDRMTRAAIVRGRVPRTARDLAVTALGRVGPARQAVARELAGLAHG